MPCCFRECNGTWALKILPSANSDIKRRSIWLQYCKQKTVHLKVPRVCMNHFSDDQVVVVNEKRHLKHNAIPDKNLPSSDDEKPTQTPPVGGSPGPDVPVKQELHVKVLPDENESIVLGDPTIKDEDTSLHAAHQDSEMLDHDGNDRVQKLNRKGNLGIVRRRTQTSEKPHVCEDCGKSFVHPGYLSRHRLVHAGGALIRCDVCDKEFPSSISLRKHKRLHTGKNVRVCRPCNATFTRRADYQSHILSEHGEKALTCEVCSARFVYRSHLTEHMRTHAKDCPFVCSFCDATFRLRTTLYHHTVRHHTYDFKRWCQRCGRGFLCNRDLEKHVVSCVRYI